MYLNFEKLWLKLAERNLSKKDICDATGISSRTMAKITKNESVTTDTLVKICDALKCDISDIVSVSDKPIFCSVYDAYIKTKTFIEENENIKKYSFEYQNKKFLISVTKKPANSKYTVIECLGNSIKWRQFSPVYRLDGTARVGIVDNIATVNSTKNAYTLFVISGKPARIEGLDEGIFRSSRHPGSEDFVHVMSMPAFKLFSIDELSSEVQQIMNRRSK